MNPGGPPIRGAGRAQRMRWLETRVPPPVVMLLLGVAGYVASSLLPGLSFASPLRVPVGLALLTAGVALNLLPKIAFKRAGTTVNPLRPEAATSLVTTGIYRHTRNPMYLGHAVILFAVAVLLANAVALAAVPAYVLFVSRFQICPEERQLSVRFPDEYARFCRQVPRWL